MVPGAGPFFIMDSTKKSAERIGLEMEAQGISPEIKLYDELAPAFMGFATRGSSSEPFAAYDYDKCVKALMRHENDFTEEEAIEFLEYNYINSWIGDGTPIFVKVV